MHKVFISLEGIEGVGKSTQISILSEKVKLLDYSVLVTREPGGTHSAELIRQLLTSPDENHLSPTAEALLSYAARDDHLRKVIIPALNEGNIVLTDRYVDSTRAYQGYVGGASIEIIEFLEMKIVGKYIPSKTIIFDISVEESMRRIVERSDRENLELHKFEILDIEYHQRLRQAFLRIARENPQRCVVIDASRPVEEVAEDVWAVVRPLLMQNDGAAT